MLNAIGANQQKGITVALRNISTGLGNDRDELAARLGTDHERPRFPHRHRRRSHPSRARHFQNVSHDNQLPDVRPPSAQIPGYKTQWRRIKHRANAPSAPRKFRRHRQCHEPARVARLRVCRAQTKPATQLKQKSAPLRIGHRLTTQVFKESGCGCNTIFSLRAIGKPIVQPIHGIAKLERSDFGAHRFNHA